MNSRKKKNWKKELLLLAGFTFVSLSLIGFDGSGCLNWLKRLSESLANPIKLEIYQGFSKFKTKRKDESREDFFLEEKVKFLERANADLKVRLSELEKENEAQRKLLGTLLPSVWNFVSARVIGLKEGFIIINCGLDDGVEEGRAVVSENILVGRVTQVDLCSSKVILPTFKGNEINALVLESGIGGVVRVFGSGQLILDDVSAEEELAKDQIIVTKGKDGVYPSNLIIGKISLVEKKEADVYQRAVLKPLLDYQQLDWVFVIKE